MQNFSIAPAEMAGSVWRHRTLLRSLVQREVVGRYRGSFMGILWSFFNPVFMLLVYTFVFSVVFKARWQAGSASKTEFALVLFAGLIVFNLFAECVNRAPGLVLANVNYVKKVVFPLEILPWVGLGSALFHAAISLAVWLLAYALLFGVPHVTVLLLPLVLLPLLLLIIGLGLALASLGVYLRDVAQFIGIVTTVLMFLSPIFYPASALPEEYRHLLLLNPLTLVIEQARDVLFWGRVPDLATWAVYLLCSSVLAWLGFAWFQKTRKGFADVL
ncbi:ABC transporter permease [Pseudoduganella sp. R-43]|uniref:ABC transporter permease n=1 Tax=unclassified Pseudoduganella TaxID=2637179 RepID=UPI003CECE9DA